MSKFAYTIMTLGVVVLLFSGQALGFSFTQNIFNDWTFNSGLLYGWSGDGVTYDYASVIDFYDGAIPDGGLSGAWLGSSSLLSPSMHWSHLLPNLSLPGSEVTAAKLFIDAAWVDGNHNVVDIEGTLTWNPLNHTFVDNTVYDLGGVDDPNFWEDGQLDVTVNAGERSLRIDRAILMLDHTGGSGGSSSEIPEPASLILFGSGLVGFAGLIRRKNRVK